MPSLNTIINMIDFNTLMLLFSMMLSVHLLALTGFFGYVAVRIIEISKGNIKFIFFMLTISTGVLSAFLDNVTCVLLIGPVTIKLCQQIGKKPNIFFFSETICATIGGAATLIGDPPNVVIGIKMKIDFIDFIITNGPLILILLPLTSFLLYLIFKNEIQGNFIVNLEEIKKDNQIHDKNGFVIIMASFLGIFAALFLSPIHKIEVSWFILIISYIMMTMLKPHNIKSVLKAVEWDTLIFFAELFVLVETLTELGLIR